MEDEWFKKDYKPPAFDEKEDANLDDVEAVFKDSEVLLLSLWIYWFSETHVPRYLSYEGVWHVFRMQEYHVTEKKEQQPAAMNAFELISMSKGLDLGNLFDEQVWVVSSLRIFLEL